jgi:hypothetical protein
MRTVAAAAAASHALVCTPVGRVHVASNEGQPHPRYRSHTPAAQDLHMAVSSTQQNQLLQHARTAAAAMLHWCTETQANQ